MKLVYFTSKSNILDVYILLQLHTAQCCDATSILDGIIYFDFFQGYRVGWVKANSKAIQAIGTHVITHNSRFLFIWTQTLQPFSFCSNKYILLQISNQMLNFAFSLGNLFLLWCFFCQKIKRSMCKKVAIQQRFILNTFHILEIIDLSVWRSFLIAE